MTDNTIEANHRKGHIERMVSTCITRETTLKEMNKFEQIFHTIISAMSDEISQFVLMQRICNILIHSIFFDDRQQTSTITKQKTFDAVELNAQKKRTSLESYGCFHKLHLQLVINRR